MVATPHLREDHPRVVPEELRPRCDEFNSRLAAEGVPLSVVSGGEVDLLHLPRNRTADSAGANHRRPL